MASYLTSPDCHFLGSRCKAPEGLGGVQQQLAFWYVSAARTSLPQATALVWQEYELIFDMMAADYLALLGFHSDWLTTNVQDLSNAILTNPLYTTTAGYKVALLSGALTLNSLVASS